MEQSEAINNKILEERQIEKFSTFIDGLTHDLQPGEDVLGRVGGGLAEVLPPVHQPHVCHTQLPVLQ